PSGYFSTCVVVLGPWARTGPGSIKAATTIADLCQPNIRASVFYARAPDWRLQIGAGMLSMHAAISVLPDDRRLVSHSFFRRADSLRRHQVLAKADWQTTTAAGPAAALS